MDYALALHPLQVAIALRGLQLLRVGGRMVYSTCSLNPLEDEAVVAELLRRCAGRVRLLDGSELLPALRRAPGLLHWEVVNAANRPFECFDAVPSKLRAAYRRSMFPPSEPDAAAWHLERCVRVLPHQQNSGGFFLCVLEKTGALEAVAQDAVIASEGVVAQDAVMASEGVVAQDAVMASEGVVAQDAVMASVAAGVVEVTLGGNEELRGIVRSEQQ